MLSKAVRLVFLALVAVYVSGCAFGHKADYQGISNFEIKSANKNIIVAVHDLRPYIQDKRTPPTFVGMMRSLYGIPYNIDTKSGKPFADDLGSMMVNTITSRKVPVRQQFVPFTATFEDVKKDLSGMAGDDRLYYVKIMEWMTDTHFNTDFVFDLQMEVFDNKFNKIAESSDKGKIQFDAKVPGQENLAQATSGVLSRLFDIEVDEQKSLAKTEEKQYVRVENTTHESSKTEKDNTVFNGIPDDIKTGIRKKCLKEFPEDFVKQAECASAQVESWKKLN